MSEDILNKFKQVQDEKKSAESDKVLKIGIIGTGWIAEWPAWQVGLWQHAPL